MPEPPDKLPSSTQPSFLKRWLGWRSLALSVFVLILLSPVAYRGWRLGQVPVIDDPFDVESFQTQTEVPDDENAAVLMLEAAEKLVEVPETEQDAYFDEELDGWDPGDATLDRYLAANEPALELWRVAADRPDYQFDLEEAELDRQLSFYRDTRALYRLAVMQTEKHIATENPQAAIPWIEAMLRHAHLFRQNSSEFNTLVGTAFFAIAAETINDWSTHPGLIRTDINQVLETLRQARLLKPPLSENVKAGYVSNKKTYGSKTITEYMKIYTDNGMHPPLDSKWKWWLEAEPQFTQRLLPHIAKNHLLFIDEPRRDRPPLIDGDLFEDSAVVPSRRSKLKAQELSLLMIQSRIFNAEIEGYLEGILDAADRDEARYRCLIVALAAQAYFRDQGEFPADAKQLVPEYLKEIPDDLYSPTPAPLIYRRDGDGAVVYSRFDNQVDDGGFEIDYDENAGSGDLMDFGYRIRNPFDRPFSAPKP